MRIFYAVSHIFSVDFSFSVLRGPTLWMGPFLFSADDAELSFRQRVAPHSVCLSLFICTLAKWMQFPNYGFSPSGDLFLEKPLQLFINS